MDNEQIKKYSYDVVAVYMTNIAKSGAAVFHLKAVCEYQTPPVLSKWFHAADILLCAVFDRAIYPEHLSQQE